MQKKVKKTAETAPEALRILWQEGFFKSWSNQSKIAAHLARRGINFLPHTLVMALRRATHLISRKQNGVLEYIQTKPAISKEVDKIENELFDEKLLKKLGKSFDRSRYENYHSSNAIHYHGLQRTRPVALII
jgi:hypothetical protein